MLDSNPSPEEKEYFSLLGNFAELWSRMQKSTPKSTPKEKLFFPFFSCGEGLIQCMVPLDLEGSVPQVIVEKVITSLSVPERYLLAALAEYFFVPPMQIIAPEIGDTIEIVANSYNVRVTIQPRKEIVFSPTTEVRANVAIIANGEVVAQQTRDVTLGKPVPEIGKMFLKMLRGFSL